MLTINNTTTIIADGQRSTSVHTELFSDGDTIEMTLTTDRAERLTGRIFPPDDYTGIQASESAAQLWHSFLSIVQPKVPLILAAARAAMALTHCELCHGEGNCCPGCPHEGGLAQ